MEDFFFFGAAESVGWFSGGLSLLWKKEEEEEEGMQDWQRRSICSEGNKSERFTVFARPPNSLAPFQELLRMIYKEAELSACPNFYDSLEI